MSLWQYCPRPAWRATHPTVPIGLVGQSVVVDPVALRDDGLLEDWELRPPAFPLDSWTPKP